MTNNTLNLQPIKERWKAGTHLNLGELIDTYGLHVITDALPLIECARDDIAALVTEVERLREEVRQLSSWI